MNSAYISVVIPVYQKVDFLSKCLDDIICQTYKNYEIVLVDDGSTDGSEKICDEYAERYSNIRVFHNQNRGVSAARNYGIDKAKYEFIAFIDADDYWNEGYLSEIAMLINKYPECGMFATGYSCVNGEHIVVNNSGITGDCIIDNYFKHVITYSIVHTSSVVIKKQILQNVGGFPVGMISSEDLYTWIKVATVCKCAYSDKKLSVYNLDAEGWRGRKGRIDNGGYSFDQLLDDDIYKTEYLSKLAYQKASYNLRNGFKREADRQIKPFLKSKMFRWSMFKYRMFRPFPQRIVIFLYRIDAAIIRRINKLKKLIYRRL